MILHVCCNLAGSRVFPELFEALRAAGEEQQVFVPEKYAANLGKNLPAGVPCLQRLTVKKSDALFFFRKAQRSVPVIRRELDLSRVRLVHAHTLFTDGSIALRLKRETGIPYGVTLRYSDLSVIWKYEPHLRPLGREILREAGFAAFLNEAARSQALGWFGGAEREALLAKSVILPNGIREEWLTGVPRTAPRDPVRVGFAGRMTERKRPGDALAAVHQACVERRFVMDACGDGPLAARFRAALRPGDICRGALSGVPAMKVFYAGVDILLVPSAAETFGMVYLEAMSQGVPVLYTRGQGFDGQFPEGAAGYAVGCGDIREQAEALNRIAKGDYAALSRRCCELAKDYAWPKIAARWTEVYGKALETSQAH